MAAEKVTHSAAIQSLFDQCEMLGAGVMKIVVRDQDGRPERAVIVIVDPESCIEIVETIEAMEAQWLREDQYLTHQAERGEAPE